MAERQAPHQAPHEDAVPGIPAKGCPRNAAALSFAAPGQMRARKCSHDPTIACVDLVAALRRFGGGFRAVLHPYAFLICRMGVRILTSSDRPVHVPPQTR